MQNSKKGDLVKNGDNQPTFKYQRTELSRVQPRSIETYIIYKEQLPGRGKSMKTLCGLITVLMILGPVWMGMMFAVDTPELKEGSSDIGADGDVTQARGTRSEPDEPFKFVDLYYHTVFECMNTTTRNVSPYSYGTGAFSFTLQDPVINDYLVRHPDGGYGMQARVYIDTPTDIEINVYDEYNDAQTLVGSTTFTEIQQQVRHFEAIDIPFETSWGGNYTFLTGHLIVVEFNFVGGGMHYDRPQAHSSLRLHGRPITDITVNTGNFNDEPTKTFYPKNIDFPVDRKVVMVKGSVTKVFDFHWREYIRNVEVRIHGQSTDVTEKADYSQSSFKYEYSWSYDYGIESGEYTATTIVWDKQNNSFTASNTFNITQYGILLTSPSQEGGEGSYTADLAKARRNVIQYSNTSYMVHAWNIGNLDGGITIDTTGPQSGWDWKLEGQNLSEENVKTGELLNIPAGEKRGFKLTVNAMGNTLGKKATVSVTATSIQDSYRDSDLTTISTVVVKYDIEMKFKLDASDTQSQNADIGDEVTYEFIVTNRGGSEDTFWFDIDNLPSTWEEEMTGEDLQTNDPTYGDYYVYLTSGDSTEFTLTLTTANTGGDLEISVEITGRSWGSKEQNDVPVVSDSITTITILSTGIMLEVVGTPEKETDPDDSVNFQLKLTNPGSSQADYTVYLTLLGNSNGWEDADISFESGPNIDDKQYTLGAGDSSSFFVYAEPTIDVLAKNYSILVHAERDDDPTARFAEKTVYVIVQEFHNIIVTSPLELDEKAEPGDDVQFKITLENRGNVAEWVNIYVTVPKDWTVDFGNASSEWSMEVQPGDMEEATVILGIPEDADGDETVDVTISVVPASSEPVQVLTHTKIDAIWYQPIFMLLVPIGLFIAIIVLVIVIFRRR
jgi:uncharacterized repeat protein (TIGR01451 family)